MRVFGPVVSPGRKRRHKARPENLDRVQLSSRGQAQLGLVFGTLFTVTSPCT